MTKEFRIIVARVDIDHWETQEKEMVPGSVIDTCRVCELSVWLSPEGHHFVYEVHPDDGEVVCVECHIVLEIERRREDENAKPLPIAAVPGTTVPLPEPVRQQWIRETEKQIKEGVEGGPSST